MRSVADCGAFIDGSSGGVVCRLVAAFSVLQEGVVLHTNRVVDVAEDGVIHDTALPVHRVCGRGGFPIGGFVNDGRCPHHDELAVDRLASDDIPRIVGFLTVSCWDIDFRHSSPPSLGALHTHV